MVECEAGVILQNLADAVGEHGYTIPLDLGARGSCFVGGKLKILYANLKIFRLLLPSICVLTVYGLVCLEKVRDHL